MSVIFGLFRFCGQADTEAMTTMHAVLDHGHADTTGSWHHGAVAFGHRMFYNTPESLYEKLPFYDERRKLCITADARLDNRDEIFRLLAPFRQPASEIADSALILGLYEKFGQDCMKHLVGDFAFAIWDDARSELFCARDHMGVKPFFYSLNDHFFAFAAEQKGLLCLPEVSGEIYEQFVYNNIVRVGSQEPDKTLYRDIRRLPPAHTLVISAEKTPRISRYWDLDAATEIKFDTREAYYEAFRRQFEIAVKCRLRSAYPVAVELSGGMDSSGIAGVAAHVLHGDNRPLISISNTLPPEVDDPALLEKSERRFVHDVVAFNKIDKAICTVSDVDPDPMREIDRLLSINDGLDSWQQLWQLPIREAAQQEGVRVLLSGFPGDELVTYRGKYYFLDYLDKKQYLRYFFARRKFAGVLRIEPFIPHRVRYALHRLKERVGWYNRHVREVRKTFAIPAKNVRAMNDVNWLNPLAKRRFNSYRDFQKWRYLRPHVAARMEAETRSGFYYGHETRFPMADIRLAQFYLSLPNELKYEGVLHRTAYRKALARYLPESVLARDNKTGGMAPWFRPPATPEEGAALRNSHAAVRKATCEQAKASPFVRKGADVRGNFFIVRWLAQQSKKTLS